MSLISNSWRVVTNLNPSGIVVKTASSICKRQRLGMAPSSTLHSSKSVNEKGQEIEAEEILFQNKPYSSLGRPSQEGGGFLSWATSLMLPLGLPQAKSPLRSTWQDLKRIGGLLEASLF
jgi:hypothetical protein